MQMMDREIVLLHPEFRLDGIECDVRGLNEIGYSLIKEGDDFERDIGDFFIDWFSDEDYISVRTSGSTGPPKMIQLTKTAMAHSAKLTGDFLGLGEGTKALLCLSASNIAGKMMLVRAMVLGWHLDYVEPAKTPLYGLQNSYDFCALVPMQVMASKAELALCKTLLIGGAPINEDLKSEMQNWETRVFESYGMTETASHIALRPLSNTACAHIEGKSDLFVVINGVGVSNDSRGCLIIDAPFLSDQPIITNDLAEIVSSDRFRWLGRWDHVINSGGVKLIPEQIETKINPYIKGRFILTGKPDATLGERLVMVIEGPVVKSSAEKIMKQIPDLHAYEIPKEIYTLDKFPETATGKIKRNEIAERIEHIS